MARRYGGTGLGLAISKHLVEMMDGEIGCQSQLGQGSCFWFNVCLKKTAITSAASPDLSTVSENAEAQLQSHYAGSKVLLAEDDLFNQEVALSLLQNIGFSVDVANDGLEALALAQTHPYHLILMDMQMPNMNGIEATQAIRTQSLNLKTPILALTANAFDEDRQLCLDAGMNDHLPKPTPAHVLYATLLKWLGNDIT